jgi:septum formation protein
MTVPARPLVLASASPARARLLRDAGFDPAVMVSGVDESAVVRDDPWEQVAALAEAKAAAVAATCGSPDALVIGCDSMLLFDGELHGRPVDAEDAIARWKRIRGNTGVLLTGHHLVDVASGRSVAAVADTLVRFGEPSDDEIAAYVASGEPFGKAGAYAIQSAAAAWIEKIEGSYTGIMGLPLHETAALLEWAGVAVRP